jgi:alkanesulfonate monooxygenase SsuD/methylene tetrahydromethanopterin reductase-like flavin-dependent oxidoreductase (luciferase family)
MAPHIGFPVLSSPLLMGAHIAARTRTLRLVTSVLQLPLYNPARLAQDAAMLDLISGGRLVLGVGAGYVREDFDLSLVSFKERVSRLEEGIEILRLAWTRERFDYAGRRYSFADTRVEPKPLQEPHPPIWVGAWSLEGVRRAARLGDGWLGDPSATLEQEVARCDLYRELAAAEGKTPFIALLRSGWVARTRERAVAEYGEYPLEIYRRRFRFGRYHPQAPVASAEAIDFETIAGEVMVGTPDAVGEQIERWQRATGADYLIVSFRYAAGPPHPSVLEAVQLFGEEVIPRFR